MKPVLPDEFGDLSPEAEARFPTAELSLDEVVRRIQAKPIHRDEARILAKWHLAQYLTAQGVSYNEKDITCFGKDYAIIGRFGNVAISLYPTLRHQSVRRDYLLEWEILAATERLRDQCEHEQGQYGLLIYDDQ